MTFETLLERQKAVWRRDRAPEDPPGGLWDTAPQPRLGNTETFIDADTAEAVELWVSEPIRGLATELLQDEHAGVSSMQMMCNPTFDYGPAPWHRDIHPIDMGPMQIDAGRPGGRRAEATCSGTFRCTTTASFGSFRAATRGTK